MFLSQGLFKLESEFKLWEKFFNLGGSVINKDTLSYDKVFLTLTTSNRTQVCFKGLSSVLTYHVQHLHLDLYYEALIPQYNWPLTHRQKDLDQV